MKKILIILSTTLLMLYADKIKDINQKAISFLNGGKVANAYNVLIQSYKNGTYNNQTLFLLGTAARLRKDYKNAVKFFELLLQKDKGANRVRLDLAVVYYKLGEFKKAKELLLIVKSSHPPKKVGDNIDLFLATIERGIPKLWSVTLGIGRMYDSNANAGPDVDTILMYNLPFALSPDAKANSDYAMKYNFDMNYIKKIDGFAWQNTLNASIVDYDDLNTLDSKNISLSTAIIKNKDRFTFSFPFIGNILIIGHDKQYYSTSAGFAPQISYRYSDRVSLNFALSYQGKKYYKAGDRKSHSLSFSPSSRIFLDRSSYVGIGLFVSKERSKTETYSNDSYGYNANYFKAFSRNTTLNIGYSESRIDYKGREIAYNKSRNDISRTVSSSLSYFIKSIKSKLSLNLSYTDNYSDIQMYKYDRKQIGINISRSF